MNRGLLGLPRLTSIGPFVDRESQFSAVSDSKTYDIVDKASSELDVDPDDLSEQDRQDVTRFAALEIYEEDTEVNNIKRVRLDKCVSEKWAKNWSSGLQKSTDLQLNDLEELGMMINACVSLVENHTPDDERLVGQINAR